VGKAGTPLELSNTTLRSTSTLPHRRTDGDQQQPPQDQWNNTPLRESTKLRFTTEVCSLQVPTDSFPTLLLHIATGHAQCQATPWSEPRW
jgi:hypothetical protein